MQQQKTGRSIRYVCVLYIFVHNDNSYCIFKPALRAKYTRCPWALHFSQLAQTNTFQQRHLENSHRCNSNPAKEIWSFTRTMCLWGIKWNLIQFSEHKSTQGGNWYGKKDKSYLPTKNTTDDQCERTPLLIRCRLSFFCFHVGYFHKNTLDFTVFPKNLTPFWLLCLVHTKFFASYTLLDVLIQILLCSSYSKSPTKNNVLNVQAIMQYKIILKLCKAISK